MARRGARGGGFEPLLRNVAFLWKPATQELFYVPIIDCFGEEFCALLISPRVIYDKTILVLAEVNVGIVNVLGFGDVLTLLCGKLRVGD